MEKSLSITIIKKNPYNWILFDAYARVQMLHQPPNT